MHLIKSDSQGILRHQMISEGHVACSRSFHNSSTWTDSRDHLQHAAAQLWLHCESCVDQITV